MGENSAITIARRVISVALTVVTALIALLWAWPKFGEGGFAWTISAPAGIGFTYLVHLLTAPRRSSRSIWVPIGITSLLTLLWFVGLMIAALATPVESPESTLSGQFVALAMAILLWPAVMAGGLIVILILKLAERAGNGGAKRARPAVPSPSAPAMPVTQSSPAFISGSSPPTGPVPTHSSRHSAASLQPRMPSAAATPRHPGTLSSAAGSSAPQEADPVPHAPHPSSPTRTPAKSEPVAADVPLHELSTLVEVAVSLGQDDASSALTLEFGDGGVTVSADGVPLGSVDGSWNGTEGVCATVLAADVLRGLRSFDESTSLVSIVPGATDISNTEFRAVGSDQSFIFRSFTA